MEDFVFIHWCSCHSDGDGLSVLCHIALCLFLFFCGVCADSC
jgi:hypothetical protein